jgi:hypothetical protein
MKSFAEILTESKKQYAFRIKLACECSKEQLADLKTALDKYSVAAISQPKETPVAKEHLGFEHIKNTRISIIDVLLDYPCNPVQVREIVRDSMGIAESHIMVTNTQQEEDALPIVPETEAVLDKDYTDGKKFDLLADLKDMLDKAETRKFEFAAKSDAKGNTTNDLPQNNKSVMGGHRIKTLRARA